MKSISQALQLYYNDFRVFSPMTATLMMLMTRMPLSTELAGYLKDKSTFVCPEDNDTTSTGNFASYDPILCFTKRLLMERMSLLSVAQDTEGHPAPRASFPQAPLR